MTLPKRRPWWRLTTFVFLMLVIEFLDEFAYGAGEAAWPLIRDAFDLNYIQIGLLLTVPMLTGVIIDPVVGVLADTGRRRLLMVGGGFIFGAGLILQGLAPVYLVFMLALVMQFIGSGAFVGLAQITLMDYEPERRENNMARWTFSGSLAVVTGPIILSLTVALGGSWRPFFIIVGIIMILVALAVARLPKSEALQNTSESESLSIRDSIQGAIALLKQAVVWRWMILLEFSDLMLDTFFSLLALYMVDVVGVTQAEAGIAVAVWTGVGLIGDFLLIPLLERVPGLVYLRISVLMELILFPAFLLADNLVLKLVLLGIIGLFNAGWYSILQGKLYDTLGEQSNAAMIIGSVPAMFRVILPLGLGVIAENYGLDATMWLLLAGPIALLIGLPRHMPEAPSEEA